MRRVAPFLSSSCAGEACSVQGMAPQSGMPNPNVTGAFVRVPVGEDVAMLPDSAGRTMMGVTPCAIVNADPQSDRSPSKSAFVNVCKIGRRLIAR